MTQLGDFEVSGKDIAGTNAKYDQLAIGDKGELYLVSMVAPQAQVKQVRAILSGGAKALVAASGGDVRKPSAADWVRAKAPGKLTPTTEGYNCYVHKLDYGLAHALFVTRMPGFMTVVSQEALWQELNDVRFTTPLLKEWMPYIETKLREKNLLSEAKSFNVTCGVLSATTASLDAIVSTGLREREIHIGDPQKPSLGICETSDEPEPEPAKPAGPASWKVAVKVRGQREPSYNACRYPTEAAAKAAAEDLFSRWMQMDGYTIEPSDDPTNR